MNVMRAVAVSLFDQTEVDLSNAKSLEVSSTLSSPAQSMSGIFAINNATGKLGAVRVYYNKKLIFEGNVDRQATTISPDGLMLSIEARSKGALLLDNEAMPCVLTNINLSTIFNIFISKYGFICYNPNSAFSLAMYTIRKDMSEWEVLVGYTKRAWGITPYVINDSIIIDRPRSSTMLKISNTKDGIPYTKIEHLYIPYKMVSEVVLRDSLGSYSALVNNSSAKYHGVSRKRYVIPTNEFMDEPGLDANQRIKRSILESEQVIVILPNILDAKIGQEVQIVDKNITIYNLIINEITYQLSKSGIVTKLNLISSVYY